MSRAGGTVDIASIIDHTLLKPDATRADIEALCREAVQWRFAAVCVNPIWVTTCAERLIGTGVKVATVVGFPSGAHLTEVKVFETRRAVEQGAGEIDMVIDIGALKSGDHALVEREVRAVVAAAGAGAPVKVILETALLTREEKIAGSLLAASAGAAFVKTCTGFAGGGATVEDVSLIRAAVGEIMGIKASGGVRTLADVRRMVAAGATRIGTSAGVAIMGESAT